jgi:hypothetical protein
LEKQPVIRAKSTFVAIAAVIILGTSTGCIAALLSDVFFTIGPLLL